jgi:hypothetical protein
MFNPNGHPALEQYRRCVALASRGILDMVHINELYASMLTLDKMLEDAFDPPYRERRASIISNAEEIYQIRDTSKYLQASYALCQKWIGAVGELLSRRNMFGGTAMVPAEDFVTDQDMLTKEPQGEEQEGEVVTDAESP